MFRMLDWVVLVMMIYIRGEDVPLCRQKGYRNLFGPSIAQLSI